MHGRVPPEIVDLIGKGDDGLEAFFDPSEFAIRTSLEDQHYWHLYRRTVLLDAIAKVCQDRSHPIVELGCGVGTVATFLNENGFHVDYADVHTEALRLARERAAPRLGPRLAERRFWRVDITRGLPPGDYRGVLLLDVLEHLPEDRPAMRAAHAALTTGGAAASDAFVLFTVPAFQMLWSPWDDLEKHKRRYTLADARALAEDTGFEVVRATYFFFPLFFAAAAVKGVRTVRDAVRGKPAPVPIEELTETTNHPALNRGMLSLLALERAWLARRDLPLGTSILVVARPR
jgi:SAM-dependent methyltransferase